MQTVEYVIRSVYLWVQLLLNFGRSMEYDNVIVSDLGRAIPTVAYFGTSESPGYEHIIIMCFRMLLIWRGFGRTLREGQAQLYRILTAYAHLDKRVGYCQGMHFIAALLLLMGLPESTAFYTFVSLMLR